MARNKYNVETGSENETPETETPDFDEILAEIEAAGGEVDRQLRVRVYRVTNDRGRASQEFCGSFQNVIDEQTIAENFGPGKYRVYWDWNGKDGKRRQTTRAVNIGRDVAGAFSENQKPNFNAPSNAAAPAFSFGGILENLTAEKVTAGIMALKALRELIAPPPPPQIDVVGLLKVLMDNQKPTAPTVSDAIVLKAMEMQKPAQPQPPQRSIIEQLRELKEAKETIAEFTDNESDNGGDKMDYFIKMGLNLLPTLLKQNAGNYQAAGEAARQIPMVNSLIENDPEIAKDFITAVANKYGDEAARQLAAGFNYSFEREPEEPQQAEEQQAEPAAVTQGV